MKQLSDAAVLQQNEWFRTWFNSRHYHQLYAHRNEEEAGGFINELVALLEPKPGSRMLDVACGKGRHAKMLAAHGFNVTGFDLAAASISEARQSETPFLKFVEHDMREPLQLPPFDYVFNLFTSFGYFDTEEENHRVIKMFAGAMKPSGVLVMDYLNVDFAVRSQTEGEIRNVDGIVYGINRWSDERHLYKRIAIYDAGKDATHEWTEQVARLTLADFTRLFAAHGLTIKLTFGDYKLNPYFRYLSPRLIMVVQKM
jgi:SAM-dependent methyltransferase